VGEEGSEKRGDGDDRDQGGQWYNLQVVSTFQISCAKVGFSIYSRFRSVSFKIGTKTRHS
jgi:hypothetical protein